MIGKRLAQQILPGLDTTVEPTLGHNSSTNRLIRHYRQMREKPQP